MKRSIKIKSAILTVSFALSVSALFGQQNFKNTFKPNFKYKANLGRIDSSRMYKIYVTPDVLAKCEDQYQTDYRIVNKAGKLVGYVHSNYIPSQPKELIFPQLKKENKSDAYNWIFENTKNLVLDHIDLKIRNNSVSRRVTLTGSDDLQNWYAIADGVEVSRKTYNDNGDGTFAETIAFPSSNYRYFKLEQGDKKLKPIAILSARLVMKVPPSKRYDTLAVKNISQKDSGNISVINITLKNRFLLNKLRLTFDGVKYYRRDIAIFENKDGERTQLFRGYITSDNRSPEIAFPSETDLIQVFIYNGDNQPLKFKSATVLQLVPVIASYLEKGEEYSLVFGDAKAGPSAFDLQLFADTLLMQPMPEITPGKIVANESYKPASADRELPKRVIWIAIALAAIILLTLTLKMTREVNKRANG